MEGSCSAHLGALKHQGVTDAVNARLYGVLLGLVYEGLPKIFAQPVPSFLLCLQW